MHLSTMVVGPDAHINFPPKDCEKKYIYLKKVCPMIPSWVHHLDRSDKSLANWALY